MLGPPLGLVHLEGGKRERQEVDEQLSRVKCGCRRHGHATQQQLASHMRGGEPSSVVLLSSPSLMAYTN